MPVTLPLGAVVTSTFSVIGAGALGSFSVPYVCPAGATFGLTSFQCTAPNGAVTPPPGVVNFSTGSVNGLPPGNYQVRGVTVTGATSGYFSPPIALNVAAGDVIACTFALDYTTPSNGTSSCTGATGQSPTPSNTATVTSALGGAPVTMTSPAGTSIGAIVPILPEATGKALPTGVTMPFGALAFTVSVASGASADITITYPVTSPAPNGYAKFVNGQWVDASTLIVAQGPGSTTIRLVDGGAGDSDGLKNGVITDPGGVAVIAAPGPQYHSSGFQAPVNNRPTVNSGRAGRTYPVKFALTDDHGVPVTEMVAVTSIQIGKLLCSAISGDVTDTLEAEASGATSLRISDGSFVFNWATPSTKGCYRLSVALADGQVLKADFDLK